MTAHHIVFRAHGGSDELSNMVSLCSWCHLHGVHEGRMRSPSQAQKGPRTSLLPGRRLAGGPMTVQATGTADRLTFRLGREPWLEVTGRERKI